MCGCGRRGDLKPEIWRQFILESEQDEAGAGLE
jgi:hypothetical protein